MGDSEARGIRRGWRAILTITGVAGSAVILSVAGCERQGQERENLPDSAREAIRQVESAYVRGWESNDPEAVMATFTDRAVVVPSEMPPIHGDSAIRGFWWPADGGQTRVSSYETTLETLGGWGPVAYMGGRGWLTYEWRESSDGEWQSYSTRSVWLALLRRQPDGTWKMTHRMWHQLGDDS